MAIMQDAMQASMPGSAKQFLGSVQPKSVGQMAMYVAILGILGLIGTVVGLSVIGICWGPVCIKISMTSALMAGIIGWIGTIVSIIGAGMVLSAMSQSIVGRQVSNEEAVTLAGYAATPALIAGILNIIPGLGWIFVVLASLYSAYLFFLGSGARFGADKALVTTIIFLVIMVVISWIFSAISGMMYASAAVGAYGGGGSVNLNLGRYY